MRAAAPRLVYGGEGAAGADDAVEALVQGLLGGRATPADAPPAEWSTTLSGDAVESDSLQPTRPAKPRAKPSGRPPNKAKPSAKAAGHPARARSESDRAGGWGNAQRGRLSPSDSWTAPWPRGRA